MKRVKREKAQVEMEIEGSERRGDRRWGKKGAGVQGGREGER